MTADTVSLLRTTAPEEASTFDLRPPEAYHQLNEAVTELQTLLGTGGDEVKRGDGPGTGYCRQCFHFSPYSVVECWTFVLFIVFVGLYVHIPRY